MGEITGQQAAAGWRKSSYSTTNGDCVEVWRKSSRSTYNGNCVEYNGNCVEVGDGHGGCGMVHVRDSKNPSGPSLSFSPDEWAAFLGEVRSSVTAG